MGCDPSLIVSFTHTGAREDLSLRGGVSPNDYKIPPRLLASLFSLILMRELLLRAIHSATFSMTGVGGSHSGSPGTVNAKLIILSSVEVDTLVVSVVETAVVEGGVSEGSDVDLVVVRYMSTTLSVRVVGVGLLKPGARVTTFSRISTPAASKTSAIGA